ncbi:MAG: asparaginase domain-containing protein [Chloroflexota bacterium]
MFAGPNATILNSEPLVTSNAARVRAGLPPLPFDAVRPQRLAAPVTVYVEQFSAHPLESDAAGLYGPPDGYVGADATFNRERRSEDDKPVYEVTLSVDDGLYMLPYMAMQADGRPWEGDESDPFGSPDRTRQPFYPSAERVFEEIDRFGVGEDGLGGQLSRLADYEFLRPAPPAGYTARGEVRGRDYFPYRPVHMIRQPSRLALARLTNEVQRAMSSGNYAGGLWLEGSPYVEETAYWLNLLIDTTMPIAGAAAQRPHGAVGDDGARNIIDAVAYLTSRVWADADGRDALGAVVVIDQQIMTARSIQKADARPGGYVTTGGHGGVLGTISSIGRPVVSMRPLHRHTWNSDVRMTVLPSAVRDESGDLIPEKIPVVAIVKHGQYIEESDEVDVSQVVGIVGRLSRMLERNQLAGFVAEGSAPFGTMNESAEMAFRRAVFSGVPVVKVGRGGGGVSEKTYAPFAIAGGNLTATKARLLLMASLLKLGLLPAAEDPAHPTGAEIGATRAALDRYQEIFDSH